MTIIITFLAASVFSSILVVAAGMLSSRVNRRESFVENYAYIPVPNAAAWPAENASEANMPQAYES